MFIDTNVLLDVLLARDPWAAAAANLWHLAEREVEGFVSTLSFANTYYVVCRLADRETAEEALRLMRDSFSLVPFDASILDRTMASDFADFEDAVQYQSACAIEAEYLVTRDPRHFRTASIPVLSPAQFLALHRFEQP